ncbi:G-D-S-L family lipolytic protein [uncultured Winogradskyella sp.]|uniref:G-D-S-L family lipolytic protein n=1 Tax=uncultured Winogradskyella sp. TaxID=395353 RepID=UPI0026137395|nr:G-D-S-L family lipolytic protein [uncultured Winogradskyella sp.]
MKNIKYIILSMLALNFLACENEELDELRNKDNEEEISPLEEFTAGTADFSNYVAVGASFTAGFTDGALFIAGQENSFPNILSQQFANGNGGTFTQPLMSDNTGGLLLPSPLSNLPYRFIFNGDGPQRLDAFLMDLGAPVPPITTDGTVNLGMSFNNVGVPGAKSFHVVTPGYGAFNPYYGRMATGVGSSMLQDAVNQIPTFFTLSEMGGNDVLSYATSGGIGVDQTGNPDASSYGSNDITDPALLAGVVSQMVDALTLSGAKGAITNVPYITDLAHFTTIGFDFLDPEDEDVGPLLIPQIPALNAQLYGPLDNIFTALGEPDRVNLLSDTEANPLLILDEDATDRSAEITTALTPVLGAPTATAFGAIFGKARQATSGDLIVLAASAAIAQPVAGAPAPVNVNGISFPLQDQWVLIPSEQMAIRNATDAYNIAIANIADNNPDVALVDLNAVLTQASTTGVEFDNYVLNTDLVTGGLISLDGIHLTSRGYALMANKFLEAIDTNFGSNFVASGNVAKANDYPFVFSPTLQ